MSFFGLLQVALIVLKLMGTIDWSWWWVWSPTMVGSVSFIGVLVLGIVLGVFDKPTRSGRLKL